ncbi:MAG: flagellar basal-body rod protein FlgB [Rhodobacteraceae bacterium HLUCCA08]|nr:MAG: flagellar basal-body rod protein FlgB [Rhodobacteraceae bacterium HLUCCA08]
MYQSLDLFRVAGEMSRHAGAAQAVTARNLANADTPGYRALQMTPFKEVYRQSPATPMRTTRPGHVTGPDTIGGARITPAEGEAKPNGNTVSLEREMVRAVDNQRQHSRALAVYRHTMTILRASIGRQ